MPGKIRPLDLILRGVYNANNAFERANKDFERLVRPINKVNNALRRLSRNAGLTNLAKRARTASTELGHLTKRAAAAGAILGGAGAAGMQKFVARGDDVGTLADKLGLSTDRIQEMQYALEQMDVPIEVTNKALTEFSRRSVEAALGTGEAALSFAELEIPLESMPGKMRPIQELFDEWVEKVSAIENESVRAFHTTKVLTDEQSLFAKALGQGTEVMRQYQMEARELGIVLDEGTVRSAADADNEFRRLRYRVTGLAYSLGAELLPDMRRWVAAADKWAKDPAKREFIAKEVVPAIRTFGEGIATVAKIVHSLVMAVGGYKVVAAAVLVGMTAKAALAMANLGLAIINVALQIPGVSAGLAALNARAIVPMIARAKMLATAGFGAIGTSIRWLVMTGIPALVRQMGILAARAIPAVLGGLRVVVGLLVANPLGLAVTAVAALVAGGAALYNSYKPFRDLIDEIWRKIPFLNRWAPEREGEFKLGKPNPPPWFRAPAGAGGSPDARGPLARPAAANRREPNPPPWFRAPAGAGGALAGPAAYMAPRGESAGARAFYTTQHRIGGAVSVDIGLPPGATGSVRELHSSPKGFDLDVGLSQSGAF